MPLALAMENKKPDNREPLSILSEFNFKPMEVSVGLSYPVNSLTKLGGLFLVDGEIFFSFLCRLFRVRLRRTAMLPAISSCKAEKCSWLMQDWRLH